MASQADNGAGAQYSPLLDSPEEGRPAAEGRPAEEEMGKTDTEKTGIRRFGDSAIRRRVSTPKERILSDLEKAEEGDREKFRWWTRAPDVDLPVGDAVGKLVGDWHKGRPERKEVLKISLPEGSAAGTGGDTGLINVQVGDSSGDLTMHDKYWSGSISEGEISLKLGQDTLLIVKKKVGSATDPAWDKAEVAHKDAETAYKIYFLRYKIQAWDTLPDLNLPYWAYSAAGVNVSMDCAVGPTIPLQRLISCMNLLLQGGMILLAWKNTDVKKGDVFNPTYENWIWLVPMPTIAMKVTAEFMMLRILMVPYVIKCRSANNPHPFLLMGFPVPMELWICFAVISTVLLAVDIASDGIFAGSSLKVLHDVGSHELKAEWHDMWNLIPSWISIHFLLWLSVCTSLVQFVWPVVATWRKEELMSGKRLNEYNTEGGGRTLNGEIHKNGNIALQLGESANLAAMGMIARKQCANRMVTRQDDPSRWKDAIQNGSEMGKITESTIVLSLILENCLQLWIQHGMFIARLRVAKKNDITFQSNQSQVQQLFSISISAVALLIKMIDVYAYLRAVSPVLRTCSGSAMASFFPLLPASPTLNEECKFHFYKARVKRFRVIILSVIVGLVFMGVVIDMLAAFTCPCVGWNVLHVFNSNHGCSSCPVHT